MPIFEQALPAIDQNLAGVWIQQDKDLYNKLPYYLEVAKTEKRKRYSVWPKLISNTRPWKPNMAEVLKLVIVEDSPVIRQEARPNPIQQTPLRDVYNVRERTVETRLHTHEFVSPHFHFLPSFQDFLKGNLIPARRNIENQIGIFEEMFYRTYLWDNAPYVYIIGKGVVAAPTGVDENGASNKTAAWLQAELSSIADVPATAQVLTFSEMLKAFTIFTDDIGATPYEGSGQPGGDSMPLDERYCFVLSSEAWNALVDDPWLKENRQLNMNIVTEAFKGDLWGRVRCKLEKFPRRFALDANFSPTSHPPETIDQTTNRTRPFLSYSNPATSQIEVGWYVGGNFAERVDSGPPPQFFAGPVNDPAKVAGMNWNGMVYTSKHFAIPRKDANGNDAIDLNEFGRYMRFQSELNLGIIGPNMHNIMPVIYRRKRATATTVLQS